MISRSIYLSQNTELLQSTDFDKAPSIENFISVKKATYKEESGLSNADVFKFIPKIESKMKKLKNTSEKYLNKMKK